MPKDKIRLHGITLYGHHGIGPAEREVGRPFSIDVELAFDLSAAGRTDDLDATINYTAVCEIVKNVHEAGPYQLLETFAERIAEKILEQFPVTEVTVRVRKPNPPVGMIVEAAEVEIQRNKLKIQNSKLKNGKADAK